MAGLLPYSIIKGVLICYPVRKKLGRSYCNHIKSIYFLCLTLLPKALATIWPMINSTTNLGNIYMFQFLPICFQSQFSSALFSEFHNKFKLIRSILLMVLEWVKLKIQFLSCTNHISGVHMWLVDTIWGSTNVKYIHHLWKFIRLSVFFVHLARGERKCGGGRHSSKKFWPGQGTILLIFY